MAEANVRGLASRVNDSNVKWYTLIAACFALFMAMLDNLVVNIAMPTIAKDLDANTSQLQWIVSAYTLVFASLQITAGGLGDRLGRKRWFLIGLAMFTATSALAAFSQNIEMLIVLRAVQGLGAAIIMPLSLSIISNAFPPEERGKAIGIWSAISVSAIALGPVVGGLVVEYASWHWVFLINIPIGIAAWLVTSAVVRESRDESGEVATDIPGTLLITGAIGALTYGLIEAGNRGWGDSLIVTMLGLAVVLGLGFIYVESKTAKPMVPLRFFKSGNFTGANIDSFMISFMIAGIAFFMTLYQQNVHGFSPVKTGLALLPMVITMMVLSPIGGAMINRVGPRKLISFGMVVTGIGGLLMTRSGVHASYLDIVPGFVVMGFGMSFIWAPMTTAMLNSVDSSKSGVASAVNGAIREIGTAFSIALLGTIATRRYQEVFQGSSEIRSLRQDSGNTFLQQMLDTIGSGAGLGGNFIRSLPGYEQLGVAVGTIEEQSGIAFVSGMERAFIIGSVALIVASVVSYFLISDEAVQAAEATTPGDEDAIAEQRHIEAVPSPAD
jgi:EmrB/QacA subfamily drug resistance transporter